MLIIAFEYFLLNIALCFALGGMIGWQRHHIGQPAGFRTFSLITLGSMLFTLMSVHGFEGVDQSRVAAQILSGIGFIGAGIIFHKKDTTVGLTTAAAFWACAAIGMAIGLSWYVEAITTSFAIFLILSFRDKKFLTQAEKKKKKGWFSSTRKDKKS